MNAIIYSPKIKESGHKMGNIYRLIEFNAGHGEQQENHPILNQVYDILAELHKQRKQNTLCRAHTEIKGNEETDKAEKQAIDMSGISTTRLPHTDY